VGGLYDGQVKVFVGATELEAWRIVAISRMPAESRFYVLLDEDVMNPGMMTVGIDVGDGLEAFTYEVLTERSGTGLAACARGNGSCSVSWLGGECPAQP